MTAEQLRIEALNLALRISPALETTESILNRAEAFYTFLTPNDTKAN